MTAKQKLLSKRSIDANGCWLIAGRECASYGTIYFDGQARSAHRFSFETFHGPIPRGMLVMHKCDVPGCFNPAHLSAGTQKENMQDMRRKGRFVPRRPNPNLVPKLRVTVSLLERVWELGKRLAKQENRSLSGEIEYLIWRDHERHLKGTKL